jgi:hypothetical protein
MRKLLLLITFIITSCSSEESNIKPSFDRTNKPITITVIFHENGNSLEEAYRQVNGLSNRIPVPEHWGFAEWNQFMNSNGNIIEQTNQANRCTIHTFRPRRQDDQFVLTMGHELLHCVYGSYHN